MDWWQALILGIIQGLTEFLPVSSSGHLELVRDLLGVSGGNDELKAFDVMLHAGTFLAVVAYFREDLKRMLTAWGKSVVTRKVDDVDARISWYIFFGTFPAILAYLFVGDFLDRIDDNMVVVSSMLIGVSFVFFAADYIYEKRKQAGAVGGIETLKWYHGVLIGVAQAVALIPGTSRSGATISVGMMLGISREAAARFSFLLGTPAVFGAMIIKLPDLTFTDTEFMVAVTVGFVASIVSGVFAISALLKFLAHRRLSWFAAYRIPVGIAFLIYFTQ